MSFGHPLLLLTLLVLPLAVLAYVLLERRRARYAVTFTNIDVLASVAGGPSPRRYVPPALFLARARAAVRRARPSAPVDARRLGQGDGHPRRRRLRLDARDGREADAPRRGAGGRALVPRARAEARQGRAHRVLERAADRRTADDRSRPRPTVPRRAGLLPGVRRHRDRRRDRLGDGARAEDASASRRSRRRSRTRSRRRTRSSRSSSSPTASRPAARCRRSRARNARRRRGSPSTRSRSERRTASSAARSASAAAACRRGSRCRPTRRRSGRSRT